MKILYLTHDNLDKPYAWRTHILEVVNGLTKRGHLVHLVAPGPLKSFSWSNLITYKRGVLGYIFGSTLTTAKEVSKTPFDILYVRGQHPSLSHFIISYVYKIPLVVEINGLIEDELIGRPIRRFIYYVINQLTFSSASKIVVISEGLGNVLADRWGVPKEKISVIPNGANPEKIYPLDKKGCCKNLGLSTEKICFLYISSFYMHHAHITLIDAVSKCNFANGVNFILVGDSATRKRVEAEVKIKNLQSNFTFCGEIQNDLIPKYLGACDVATILLNTTTNYQWSPLKLFEAMSAGRPVLLSSNNTNLVDFVRDNEIGLSDKLDINKPQDLANLINKMLQNRNMWQKWGENGRNLILKKYSWDKSVEKLEMVLGSIP